MKLTNEVPVERLGGTCLVGYLEMGYDDLVKALREPDEGDGEKVQVQWRIQFDDGLVCAIYDWKEYDTPPTKVTDWHVGGDPQSAREIASNLEMALWSRLNRSVAVELESDRRSNWW